MSLPPKRCGFSNDAVWTISPDLEVNEVHGDRRRTYVDCEAVDSSTVGVDSLAVEYDRVAVCVK